MIMPKFLVSSLRRGVSRASFLGVVLVEFRLLRHLRIRRKLLIIELEINDGRRHIHAFTTMRHNFANKI